MKPDVTVVVVEQEVSKEEIRAAITKVKTTEEVGFEAKKIGSEIAGFFKKIWMIVTGWFT